MCVFYLKRKGGQFAHYLVSFGWLSSTVVDRCCTSYPRVKRSEFIFNGEYIALYQKLLLLLLLLLLLILY